MCAFNTALASANDAYSSKLASGKATHQTLFAIGWKVDELVRLNEKGRQLFVQCQILRQQHADRKYDVVTENFPRQLTELRQQVATFIKGVTRTRWIAATHLLVFMISSESRDKKPYAILVQCLPYTGMSEDMIRTLANRIITEMTSRGMKVAGEHYRYTLVYNASGMCFCILVSLQYYKTIQITYKM